MVAHRYDKKKQYFDFVFKSFFVFVFKIIVQNKSTKSKFEIILHMKMLLKWFSNEF